MKKLLIAAAALAVVVVPIAASAAPFGHDDRGGEMVRVHNDGFRGDHGFGRGWDGRYNDGRGSAVAAGLFGFVLGAALSNDRPYYAQPCSWETQAHPGPYGTVRYEQVQVCR